MHNLFRKILLFVIYLVLFSNIFIAQKINVIQSSSKCLVLEIELSGLYEVRDTLLNGRNLCYIKAKDLFDNEIGYPLLPTYEITFGVPHESSAELKIEEIKTEKYINKFVIPSLGYNENGIPNTELFFDEHIYSFNQLYPESSVKLSEPLHFRYSKIGALIIYPFQFNPYTRELIFNKSIRCEISFVEDKLLTNEFVTINDEYTKIFLENTIINFEYAENWIKIPNKKLQTEQKWYNPEKKYFKIFLEQEGVYRLYFNYLKTLNGFPTSDVSIPQIAIYNLGERMPLEIIDNGDNIFNDSDYIQFVGVPPPATDFCKSNIYNAQNIYWLTFEGDVVEQNLYKYKDGYSNEGNPITTVKESIVFEKDSLFERLGYAPNGNRDYWFWDRADGKDGQILKKFEKPFPYFENLNPDISEATLRIEMHGLNNYTCVYDHNVSIYINDVFVDNVQWDGQNKYLFQKIFPISLSGINFNSSGNKIRIETLGNICAAGLSDNILVNWFEFEYWAYLKANSNNLIYNSYPYVSGKKDFQIRNWNSSTIKIFIPEKEVIITNANIIGNPEGNVLFKDTLVADTRYYCVSNDFYLLPDSVVLDINSNLSNTSNGADYIIITHKNFTFAAQELATFRSNNLDGFENARVKVIDVQDIYDEFSYGLLNPYALKDFISYAFNNWTYPAPFYVVLFGDMSWDYKKLLPTSRPNFIPSIPYHSYQYGLAACDNNFVAVAGNDLIPDLSIGRLSCETIEEANILVEKIINYPTDYSKEWKENVILIGAGQNAEDEARFGFNNDNIALENLYLKNNGYTSTKIFRYPSTIEHQQFQGSGPEIRSAINNGGALVNFYGHGGGQQWDLVFLNDDIHLLQNGNKLPVVTSVTCYTAHFDNQNVFGEIFNKVPNKGSIGFWGNTGLTFYNSAVSLNKLVYDELCNKNNYVIGAAILSAKIRYGATYSGIIATDQMVLMTFLGDPALRCVLPDKPDFNIKSSFIATEPENPTVGSNAIVKILIQNLGRIFLGNEVKIKLIAIESDTTYSVGETQLSSFGQKDSVYFNWIPINSGLTILRAEINYDQAIDEIDFSDNSAEKDISVFNLGEPETIKPLDGHFTSGDEIDFLILKKEELENLKYYIEIDTTIFFTPPIFREEISSPADYFSYRLTKSQIEKGNYFWRVRSFDGFDSSDWTTPKSFTIKNVLGKGYYASGKHLDYFTKNNFYYDDSLRSLVLNIGLLPPKPQSRRLTDSIDVSLPPNFGMTTITNNGRFIYYANMSYFNSGEPSPIYKLGTGYNSIRGQDYGTIPNFEANIKSQIFHFDGYIYVVNGNPYYLVKVNPETGDTNNIFIPSGMLNKSGVVKSGDFYVNSDNKYVYNIALWDTNGNEHFVIRKFDPNNGWLKIGDDMITSSSSYIKGFGGFFICDDYFFPYEYYTSGFMRRIRISDGLFEEEWFTGEPYRGYFSWSYDNLNDVVYASTFRHLPNQIHIFTGHYKEGKGTVTTPKVGPSSQWQNIYYELNLSGYKGNYNTKLLGFNRYNKSWQEIKSNLQNGDDISDLDAKIYGYIKIISEFEDNTDIFSQPAKIENYQINFESVPELIMPFGLMDISKDTVLQGLKNEISFSVKNIGFIEADSALVEYFINNSDKAFYYEFINVPIDSLRFVSCEINTSELTKLNEIKIKVTSKYEELFTNNNVVKKSFFVNTDDVPPICKVTFDGVEILNGDYVSPSPKIIFLLKDNSPFPLDSSLISIYHNYRKLSYKEDSLNFDYTEYPRAEAIIEWHPTFEDGDNYISLYATDASKDTNNSVRYDINFIVSSDDKILDIYNYPNPFQSETYFTFNLTGKELPNDINIKIYTIAGRLIRDIHIPFTEMNYGFNKIRWDGTDQDGDEIANGVYFYKTTVKYDDKTEAQINKLAKVK